ncbi:YncE family protein [Methylovirgula sp. 4M-Z18]|nr:YncE family protein [Methylovirgula sp. 4M-Z18]
MATSVLLLACAVSTAKAGDAPGFYHQIGELKLGGTGTSWDHIDYDPSSHRAYLSRRADGLTVVDVMTNAVVGQVANAKGSGASAIVPKLDRGFTANTDGSTSVFKLSDLSPVDRVSFGDNFDGVVYDEATNILAYQQADNSKELLVDAATMKLVGTIEVEGTQLERPVVDNKSNLYLPLRDKHMVYKIDLKEKKIVAKWDVSSKCTEPSGSEFDVANNRLLLPCRGKQLNPVLAIIDADTGAITGTAISGRGADDVILDPATKQLFISAGVDGVLTIYKQESADKYTLTEALQTRPSLRVIRYDAGTQKIFGVTAEGIYDASKKNLAAVSPFYANAYTPGTFVMLTYGR